MVRFRVGDRPEYAALTLSATVSPVASYTPERLRFASNDPAEQVVTFKAERVGGQVRVLEASCSTQAVTTRVEPDGCSLRVTVDRTRPVADGVRHTLLVKVVGFDSPWLEIPISFNPNQVHPQP
jgi:hypothetical protein